MVRKNGNETADEKMENISRKKNNLLLTFIEAVKEVAVDCELFKSHNMMGSKYKCFNFNEDSLLEKPIGPAYNQNIEYDIKIDNGSNSAESSRSKIKVKQIKAVKLIEDNLYSESQIYWYYDESGMVYDFDLKFPIGRVNKDLETGLPIKLDKDTYIIGEVIDIPDFKIYSQ
jgi:hypothetical protein